MTARKDRRRPQITIIIPVGRPGCGKGTTIEEFLKSYTMCGVITMGNVITREIVSKTALGKQMERYTKAGELVPSSFVTKLYKKELEKLSKEGFRWIISDGFPREKNQFNALKTFKHIMIEIDLSRKEAIARMCGRGREGEDIGICNKRQDVFEEHTQPLITMYKENHPWSFRTVNGNIPALERAQVMHQHICEFDNM